MELNLAFELDVDVTDIWTVLAKIGKTVKIIKKALGTFFSSLQDLSVKFHEKVMNGFREKALRTHGQRHGQTPLLRSQTTVD